ncbi:cell division ATP-binding protein FtsE [Marinobacter pelagius]|uniref:Cell division ATP-binding protein FtsE n=1 Tax=Marinobacter pelagius TaxID=379482 RepID=A0A366GC07_9GAMM|nr:cell division ATP-binding protein FtsE [Marinobacter pelagius]RBP23449.1 cell division ATP-binding protein FtsE [Marinobacter pelagius]
MIEFRQVTKRYDSDHTALAQVNFSLNRGELAFLTGHSGAGKSTLLKLIMVMERPSAGEVVVGGQLLNRLPRRQIPYIRRHIGVVFQNHQLLFDRTVFDNVAMPLEVMGASPRDIGRRVRAALDKVGLLNKEKMNPMQLSGGEQQRVGIARAVVNKPPVLLADEPTGNLDPELSADIMNLFTRFSQVGVTVLIATHDIGLVNEMDRRTLALDHGRLIGGGSSPLQGAPGGVSGH